MTTVVTFPVILLLNHYTGNGYCEGETVSKFGGRGPLSVVYFKLSYLLSFRCTHRIPSFLDEFLR